MHASPNTTAASSMPFLHHSRIGMVLDQRLTAETVRKLQNCPRLHEQLAALMRTALMKEDLWPIPGSSEFLSAPARPRETARLAGAIWHGASLRLVVTGKAASELVAAVGEKAFTFGLRHAASAVAPAQPSKASDLAEAIKSDGLACLGAWLTRQPKPRRDAVLLRLSPEDVEQTRRFGPTHEAACEAMMALVMAEEDAR
jgi:hypothetical protein